MINWKVRFKNKWFWVTVIPAALLVIQAVGAVFGFELDFTELSDKLLEVVNTVFGLLTILGIAVDLTTKGIGDSKNALTYEAPKGDE